MVSSVKLEQCGLNCTQVDGLPAGGDRSSRDPAPDEYDRKQVFDVRKLRQHSIQFARVTRLC